MADYKNFGYCFGNNGIAGSTNANGNYIYTLVQEPKKLGTGTNLCIYKKVTGGTTNGEVFNIDVPYRMMMADSTLATRISNYAGANDFLKVSDLAYPTDVQNPDQLHIQLPLSRNVISNFFKPGMSYTLQRNDPFGNIAAKEHRIGIISVNLHDISSTILLDPAQSSPTIDVLFILINTRVTLNIPALTFDYTIPVLLKYEYNKSLNSLTLRGWTYPFSTEYMNEIQDVFNLGTGSYTSYSKNFIPGFLDYSRGNYYVPTAIGCLSSMCLDGAGKLYITTVNGRVLKNLNSSQRNWNWFLNTTYIDTTVHDITKGEESLTIHSIFGSRPQYTTEKLGMLPYAIMGLSIAADASNIFIGISEAVSFELQVIKISTSENHSFVYYTDSSANQLSLISGDLFLAHSSNTTANLYQVTSANITSFTTPLAKTKEYGALTTYLFTDLGSLGNINSVLQTKDRSKSASFTPFTSVRFPEIYPYSSDKSTMDISDMQSFIGFYIAGFSSSFIYITKFVSEIHQIQTYRYNGTSCNAETSNVIYSQFNTLGIYSALVPNQCVYTSTANPFTTKFKYTDFDPNSFSIGSTAEDIYWADPATPSSLDGSLTIMARIPNCSGIFKSNSDPNDLNISDQTYAFISLDTNGSYTDHVSEWSKKLANIVKFTLKSGTTILNSSNSIDQPCESWVHNFNSSGNFDLDITMKLSSTASPLQQFNNPSFSLTGCTLNIKLLSGNSVFAEKTGLIFDINPPAITASLTGPSGKTISTQVTWTPTGTDSTNILYSMTFNKYNSTNNFTGGPLYTLYNPKFPVAENLTTGEYMDVLYSPSLIQANTWKNQLKPIRQCICRSAPVYCVAGHQYSFDLTSISFDEDGIGSYEEITDSLRYENDPTVFVTGPSGYFRVIGTISHQNDGITWKDTTSTYLPELQTIQLGAIKRSDFYKFTEDTGFRRRQDGKVDNKVYSYYPNVDSVSALIGYNIVTWYGYIETKSSSGVTDAFSLDLNFAVPDSDRYMLVLGCIDEFNQASLWNITNVKDNFRF